jgi:hypothetical protein
MTVSGKEVLLVGQNWHSAQILADRLHLWGFRGRLASNMREATDLLNSHPDDLVRSNTHLPDGTGLGLLTALAGLPIRIFLCLPFEDSWYWLPAIDGGKDCLGLPALCPSEFASAFEEMAQRLAVGPSVN